MLHLFPTHASTAYVNNKLAVMFAPVFPHFLLTVKNKAEILLTRETISFSSLQKPFNPHVWLTDPGEENE